MSKHERQHNLTNMNGTSITDENPLREAKRARRESENPPSNAQWPALYINTQIKEESIKITDKPPAPPQQKQQPPAFSSCFSTDKLLMPDTKKSPSLSQDKLK